MGGREFGFAYIMQHFALERLIMGVNAHARAEYALDYTINIWEREKLLEKPLINSRHLRHSVADMASEVEMCKEFNYSIVKRMINGVYVVKEASMSKLAFYKDRR
jgi:acyl-CoA dehydrogenase